MNDDVFPDTWTDEQCAMFQRLYRHMLGNQTVFSHPKAARVPGEHWQTTCWNAAWVAVLMHAGCGPLVHEVDGEIDGIEVPPGAMQ